jgi:hypothetical protein
MIGKFRHAVSCVMLLAMFATFVSPSFGGGMVIGHTGVAVDVDSHHSTDPEHAHAAIPGTDEEHQDAHASVGHMIGHLPISLTTMPRSPDIACGQPVPAFVPTVFSKVSYAPPLRPPRHQRIS